MSSGQQPNLNQIAQTIAQYRQNMEYLNSSILTIRQNIERTDISAEERDTLRKQEVDLQTKHGMFQNLINQMTQQLYAQQRALQSSQSPAPENSSTPGSPATFNPQQPNFSAVQAATLNAQQQQQLRNVQQQQQLQNKMTFASPTTQTSASPQTTSFASPNQPQNKNGMFTFSSNPNDIQPAMEPHIPQLRPVSVSSVDNDGVSRVLTKRKIQELVTQIDPSERLEPEVEDILLEIADEFIESVTTFACKLAKHRKSDVLEVKDVQLHLERNWNIRIPGFAADDIRTVKKPNIPSSHQSKIQAIHTAKSQNPSKK